MYLLPEKFRERMKNLLPENEREDFFAVYEKEGFEKGLLINSLKITAEEFEKITPLFLDGVVPWAKNARFVKDEKVGGDPYHAAGLYYMQEPSASFVAPQAEAEESITIQKWVSFSNTSDASMQTVMQEMHSAYSPRQARKR